MKVSPIKKVEIKRDLRKCPQCSYEFGFHISFLKDGDDKRLILICPDCGGRYDVGWKAGF